MQPTTHLDPHMSVCRQACIMHAAVNPAASFFFLEFGRCRAKARSLHEHKLSKRRLYKDTVGPYEQANLSRITKKTHKTTKPRRPANPPARLAFRQRKQQNKQQQTKHKRKGAGAQTKHPQNRFAKGHSGLTTASLSKTCEKMN